MKSEKEYDISEMSEVDLAFHILKQREDPVYFRELIEEILSVKPVPSEQWSRAAAAIYTQLNLDTRFSYLGEGRWTLRSGQPTKTLRRITLIKRLSNKGELTRGVKTRLRLIDPREEGSSLVRHLELVEWRSKDEEDLLEEE